MRRTISNKSLKQIPWLTFVSASAILVVLYILIGQVFVVKQVRCTIEGDRCPDVIQQQLQTELGGRSLFFSNHQQQVAALQLSQPIELLQIHKELPAQLMVSFSTTEPSYALQIVDTQYLVDIAGRMSFQTSTEGNQRYQVIEFIGSETEIRADNIVVEKYHQFILDLLHQLSEHRISAANIEVIDVMEARIAVADGNIYILDTTNPAQQVQKIEYIRKYLQTNTIEISAPFEIDVRFRQPVLRSRQ